MNLQFDNAFTNELPADPIAGSARRQLRNAVFSRVTPKQFRAPQLVGFATEMAELIGLEEADIHSEAFAEVFTGNRVLPGMDPHATCYGGHQFGNWAGQLGDGRAINLGEVRDREGRRQMLQLKGSGETPYSRTADGLAVLRSSVREFLCSEAMHHLGVPTTRALSLCLTGESVMRDMLYDGHPAPEPGAVVCRIAPTFIRFGHFEILAARQELALLAQLADHTIRHHFPHLLATGKHSEVQLDKDTYLAWFGEICQRTAQMIVHWQRVGFVHGVMNTDNMSILGLTIDYGPYGWLDDYNPGWTPNTTDQGGRYAYANQGAIAQWNLLQLANALFPLIGEAAPLEAILRDFGAEFSARMNRMQLEKLGLQYSPAAGALRDELFELLPKVETDMTIFFRALAQEEASQKEDPTGLPMVLQASVYGSGAMTAKLREQWSHWFAAFNLEVERQRDSLNVNPKAREQQMQQTNPCYVLRNFRAQLAIDAAEGGDFSEIHTLLEISRQPYTAQSGREAYAALRPEWARTRVGCSQLSCSS